MGCNNKRCVCKHETTWSKWQLDCNTNRSRDVVTNFGSWHVSLSQFLNSRAVGTYFVTMPPPKGWVSRQFTSYICDHCRSKSLKTTNTGRKKKHLLKCIPFARRVQSFMDEEDCVTLRQIPADLLEEVANKSRRIQDLQHLLPELFPVLSDSVPLEAMYNRSQPAEDIPVFDRSTSRLSGNDSPSSERLSDNNIIRFDSRVDAPQTWNHNDTGISTVLDIPVLNQDPWCDTSLSPRGARR